MLQVRDLTVRYGALTILDGVSFSLEAGEWLMIVGPNGAGKSTLVSAIAQTAPYQGKVLLEGRDAAKLPPRQLALGLGVLAQNNYVSYDFTVLDVVRLGRYAHRGGLLSGGGQEDEVCIAQALEQVGLSAQAGQSVRTLSGGELQRAFLAQLLVQGPKLLILDEPTNHLDLVYQQQIFRLTRDWLTAKGGAIISVVHDLSLALAFGTRALLLDQGRVAGCGPVRQVLSREKLQQVYRLDVYQWMQQMLSQWEDTK